MAATMRRSINPLDDVKSAGRPYVGRDEGAAYCMTMPATSDGSPGIEAAARRRAQVPDKDARVFGGIVRGETATTGDVFRPADPDAAELATRLEEKLYASVRRAPLGRATAHPVTQLPAETRRRDFAFGVKSVAGDDAKSVIFPVSTVTPGDVEGEKLYQRSHGSYPVGARRTYGLDWTMAGVDPDTKVFGKKATASSAARDAVHGVLQPERAEGAVSVQLVPLSAVEARMAVHEPLGASRFTRTMEVEKHPQVYGRPTRRAADGAWGVADCMRGDMTEEERQPDPDLGRSVGALAVGGRRAPPPLPDPDRRFGVPSIRTDVPPRHVQSVAATTDFGSAPGAAMLLTPSPYAEHGVEEKDFVVPRTKSDLASIFASVGFSLTPAEVDAIYAQAAATQKLTPPGSVSIEEFRRVLDELLEARETGESVPWMVARS